MTSPLHRRAKWLPALLRPGVRAMRSLTLRSKMMVFAAIASVPLLLYVALVVSDWHAAAASVAKDRRDLALARDVAHLRRVVIDDLLAANSSTTEQAPPSRVGAALDAVQARLLQEEEGTEVRHRFDDVRHALPAANATSRDAALALARAAEQGGHLMREVLLRTRGTLGADPRSAIVDELLSEDIQDWLGDVARVTANPDAVDLGAGSGDGNSAFAAASLAAGLAEDVASMRDPFDRVARAHELVPVAWPLAQRRGEDLAALARQAISSPEPGTIVAIRAKAGETLEAISALEIESLDLLDATLDRRAAEARRPLWLLACVVLGMGALTAYAITVFHYSFAGALHAVLKGVSAAAEGDLSFDVSMRGDDELAAAGRQLDQMGRRLSGVVADIRTSAVRVGQAGLLVAGEGKALSQRSAMQGVRLRDAIQNVSSLSRDVANGAHEITTLKTLTNDMRNRMQEGANAMRETVGGIDALEARVRRVAEINGVIDDIAYQTRMLALNASVEAARAGHSGKGFAVVAGEVRELAQRCAESAQEIRDLVERTTEQVGQSAQAARAVRTQIDDAVGSVDDLASRLERVAEASGGYNSALRRMSEDVGALDELTRENNETVQRTATAADFLTGQAECLQAAVATIQLRSGTADEAQAMVARAMGRIAEIGWDGAVAEFHARGGPWVDRDLHLFALDAEGRFHVMAADPRSVGRRLSDQPETSEQMAERFMGAALAAVATGGGWIEYEGVDLSTLRRRAMTAYVQPVDERVFIGCGVYTQASDPATHARAQASAAGRMPDAARPVLA